MTTTEFPSHDLAIKTIAMPADANPVDDFYVGLFDASSSDASKLRAQ